MTDKIDYALFVSEKQLNNSLELYDFHELTGGTFRLIITAFIPHYKGKVIFSEDFSDKCDCSLVKDRCRKNIPLIFSNN